MKTAPEGYEKIHKFIDSKPYFLSWEMDTFLIFSSFFGFGLIFTDTNQFWQFLLVSGVGIISSVFYEKVKNSSVKGFFWHIIYMIGFKKPKTLPPSYMRIFIGA